MPPTWADISQSDEVHGAGSNENRDCLQRAGLQEKQKKFSYFKHDLWDL